jgi:hypothetical protein
MTFDEDLQALFDKAFKLQLDGRPQRESEWGIPYLTVAHCIVRFSSGELLDEALIQLTEQRGLLGAVEGSIEYLHNSGSILVWRVRPQLTWYDEPVLGSRIMRFRFRAHMLTQEAFDKGPLEAVENSA